MSETWDKLDAELADTIEARHVSRGTFQPNDEPTDDDIYNGSGVEGGIAYGPDDSPGSLGENDWRL
jgi:hypothetical protein